MTHKLRQLGLTIGYEAITKGMFTNKNVIDVY